LLESVSLKNAAGIIANFTGGSDLALIEVQEALTILQKEAGGDTEIVLGVTNDDRMEDRAQLILVITGLGSPTLEETITGYKRTGLRVESLPNNSPAQVSSAPISPTSSQPNSASAVPSYSLRPDRMRSSDNLDMPSFLRRRSGFAA
jgi:cell division protein FtsZ